MPLASKAGCAVARHIADVDRGVAGRRDDQGQLGADGNRIAGIDVDRPRIGAAVLRLGDELQRIASSARDRRRREARARPATRPPRSAKSALTCEPPPSCW